MIRMLFLGQKPLAEHSFATLLAAENSDLQVCAVVSNESTAVWWGANAIAAHALATGIPFVSNARKHHDRIREIIRSEGINLLLSIQHTWILPPDILEMVGGRAFNLHNAKLPDYKGNNTLTHAILNGERQYTSTLHWMVPEVDMGPVVAEAHVDIDPDDTAISLYRKTQGAVDGLFHGFVSMLTSGAPIPATPVTGTGTFYAKDDIVPLKEIRDLSDPVEVDLKARAFHFPPFEPAYAIVRGKRVYVTPDYARAS